MAVHDLRSRAEYSEQRISQFRQRVADRVPELANCPNLGIYTTGSFGRREAGPNSDLDLFFVCDTAASAPPKNLKKLLIDADLVRLCAELGYPEFSADGGYLKIHTVEDLSTKIGDQWEDAENHFTARMLLLLESEWLHNQPVYDLAITACINQYYRDHATHPDDFRPLFLLNDVIRYWKTLCLNYEAKRTKAAAADRAKHKVKNLKLKNSRMMTCFSLVACLGDWQEAATPERVMSLVRMTPTARLRHITSKHGLTDLYGQIEAVYEWFLSNTAGDQSIIEKWVVSAKDDVRRQEHLFGNLMYELLKKVAEATDNTLRFLVV